MKVLLDTHILLWSLMDSPNLPQKAKDLIDDAKNEIYYSVVSLWEIEIKHINQPIAMPYSAAATEKVSNEAAGFKQLQFTSACISRLSELKRPDSAPRHKDPFDRILICQAITEEMVFLTHDSVLSDYGVKNVLVV